MNQMGWMCLNWKVVAGLAAVGLGVWALVPEFAGAAVPVLITLACPLSMVVMLFAMRGMRADECATQLGPPAQASRSIGVESTREGQLAALNAQLAAAQGQQEAIAHEIARLEAESRPTVREPEAIARTAGERSAGHS